jgi:putative ABC transport system permease protein
LIADYRETHPIITQGLDRATTFLSLVSLITLIVGALGVATAMHAHLQQKMDSIAIMKCLGARSNQIVRIYLLQTLGLGAAGGFLGVLAGTAIERAFPIFLARYFQLQPVARWDALTAVQGMAVGLLATLLFTLPPLLSIRRIRPGAIFRREMAELRPSWRVRLAQARLSIAAGFVILLGIGGIAASLTSGSRQDALRTGAYFVLALIVSMVVLAGIAWLLLRGLRTLLRRVRLPASLRHGIANLYRPGNHAQAALIALGIGVMFTMTVYLVERGVLSEMQKASPPGMPNVFLIDIAPQNRDGVLHLLTQQKGLTGAPELIGTVAAKLVSFDGKSIDSLLLQGWARRFRYSRQVTSAADQPRYAEIVRGKWWAARKLATPELSISEEVSKTLGLQPGSSTEWSIAGRSLVARVACIHKIDTIHLASRVEFIFSSGALDGFPIVYYGSLRAQPSAVPALQEAMFARYPTISVMNMADVLQTFQGVVDQIAMVIRFISMFAILAGAIILSSSVAGTRFRRIREVVILKTLGATRWRVSRIFSIEFLILGAVAGMMGALLANGFAGLLLKRMLKSEATFAIWPSVAAVVLTALIANAAGWLASFRLLGQKPLQILREE